MGILWIIAVLWIVCGVYSFGALYSYVQNKYPLQAKEEEREDFTFSLICSLFGIIAIFIVYCWDLNSYGLKFKRDLRKVNPVGANK